MGSRVRGVAVVVVVLAVGTYLGSAVQQWWEGPRSRSGPEIDDAVIGPDERIRVEVLNGAGEAGWARAATSWLRDRGFDVVEYGNAEVFDHDTSVVYDRVGRPEMARAVATTLGIDVVRTEPDPNLYLDVSVVLGEDWERPDAESTPSGEPPWWDVRRFFGIVGGAGEDATPGRMADPGADDEGRP